METLTDQPGVQVYTACGTDIPAARAARITENTAPSAWKPSISPIRRITRQFIGTTVLRPGEKYDTTTIYAFRTE